MICCGENDRPCATKAAGRIASAIELDAADAAAGGAGDMPAALVQPLRLRRLQPHPQLDPVVERHDVQ